ncbi:DNA repair ATPase [Protofrankia coriariae]|uniref:DNA repair ATPase n=2 Tax=Protofrankia coriariae TaxID=1562887 RepID=A0ABR5F165_9ACTN|nr:DNA repair ATPase [Protofrankia coriariae]
MCPIRAIPVRMAPDLTPIFGTTMSERNSSEWGRVGDDGTVYVRTTAGERPVGSWRAGSPAEGLAHFARRYDDLAAEVTLLEQRLTVPSADLTGLAASARRLLASLGTAAVVGDLDALTGRLGSVLDAVGERTAQREAERAQRAAAAVEAKEALVAESERLARSSDWKAVGERFRSIAVDFRAITGVDRRTDADLWKRVTAAREEFNQRRTAHFAALDQQRAQSRQRKEAIVTEAEALVDSTEWSATSAQYRTLMNQWKSAGRAPRDVEDALWARFRAAQDTFFARRNAANAERDAHLRVNQAAKEQLLAEVAALDLARPDQALRRLRQIEEQWDLIGKVPRDAVSDLERRLSAVSDRIRSASDARWRRQEAVESPFVATLRESVAKLEARLERARAHGRTDEVAETESALATQREWLAHATR